MSGMKSVVSLSFTCVLGLTLLVLGCALPSYASWWPMFVIVFYLLAPFPLLISRNVYECEYNVASPGLEFALFATTGIVFSAFALPFVLAHAGVISTLALFFVFAANLVMFFTVHGLFRYMSSDVDAPLSFW